MTAIDMVAKENADYSPKAISCPILNYGDSALNCTGRLSALSP